MYKEIIEKSVTVLTSFEALDGGAISFDGSFNPAVDIVSSLKRRLPELIIENAQSWSKMSYENTEDLLLLVLDLGLATEIFVKETSVCIACYQLLREIKKTENDDKGESINTM